VPQTIWLCAALAVTERRSRDTVEVCGDRVRLNVDDVPIAQCGRNGRGDEIGQAYGAPTRCRLRRPHVQLRAQFVICRATVTVL
jgi:hypothetical protein